MIATSAFAAPLERPMIANQTPLGGVAVQPTNANLASLGETLFFTTMLSRDGSVACASCHAPSAAFSGLSSRAVGVAGVPTLRRAPPIFQLGSAAFLMWDGRAPNIERQILLPLEGREMAVDWPQSLRQLHDDPTLRAQFKVAGKLIDRTSVITALATYVRSLSAGKSPFDRFYYGGDKQALTPQQLRGWRVFSREARCVSCHLVDVTAAPFTDGGFHATGVGFRGGAYPDAGRASVTGRPADVGLFKTPTLRNVAIRPYLMHDGCMTSLRQVISYYNRGGNRNAVNLDARIEPLYLTIFQIDDLIAFLGALTSDVVSVRKAAPSLIILEKRWFNEDVSPAGALHHRS